MNHLRRILFAVFSCVIVSFSFEDSNVQDGGRDDVESDIYRLKNQIVALIKNKETLLSDLADKGLSEQTTKAIINDYCTHIRMNMSDLRTLISKDEGLLVKYGEIHAVLCEALQNDPTSLIDKSDSYDGEIAYIDQVHAVLSTCEAFYPDGSGTARENLIGIKNETTSGVVEQQGTRKPLIIVIGSVVMLGAIYLLFKRMVRKKGDVDSSIHQEE